MRTTETIEGLIRERGKKGEPLERVYRLLYNPELYLISVRQNLQERRRYNARNN